MAIIALIISNSPWGHWYADLWRKPLAFLFQFNVFTRDTAIWINEGLMTFFFLLIGLELKREMAAGELSSIKQTLLPAVAAFRRHGGAGNDLSRCKLARWETFARMAYSSRD